MAKKAKTSYVCTKCGADYSKWVGQCSNCQEWNTIVEFKESPIVNHSGYAGKSKTSSIVKLVNVTATEVDRISTHSSEMDKALGGGLVNGSVVLVGGDPGIGKSTLLIQTLSKMSSDKKVLYVSGEESPEQIKMRAIRLNLDIEEVYLLSETNVENIIAAALEFEPKILVLDSIQTIFTSQSESSPGSSTQLKEATAILTRSAKENGFSVFIVGHVTKEGAIAGPKVLEHIVDTVLYFEGEQGSRFRLLRATKNRFGEVNECGIFAMLEDGLHDVKNPSGVFLQQHHKPLSGSCIFVTKQGNRPLMFEIQSLVSEINGNQEFARRVTLGIEKDRLQLICALLNKKAKVSLYKYDIYMSVVGGFKIEETASDIPVILSILSSFNEKPLGSICAFGEIGLSGEIRPVPFGEERIKEAIKHGIKKIIIPKGNLPRKNTNFSQSIEIIAVDDINDVMDFFNKI